MLPDNPSGNSLAIFLIWLYVCLKTDIHQTSDWWRFCFAGLVDFAWCPAILLPKKKQKTILIPMWFNLEDLRQHNKKKKFWMGRQATVIFNCAENE